MSNSISQIPVRGNTEYTTLEKVCDDLYAAHKAALRALEDAKRILNDPSTYPPSAPPLNMDEIRVRHWLRAQHGPVINRRHHMDRFDIDAARARMTDDSTFPHRECWPSMEWVWDEMDDLRARVKELEDELAETIDA